MSTTSISSFINTITGSDGNTNLSSDTKKFIPSKLSTTLWMDSAPATSFSMVYKHHPDGLDTILKMFEDPLTIHNAKKRNCLIKDIERLKMSYFRLCRKMGLESVENEYIVFFKHLLIRIEKKRSFENYQMYPHIISVLIDKLLQEHGYRDIGLCIDMSIDWSVYEYVVKEWNELLIDVQVGYIKDNTLNSHLLVNDYLVKSKRNNIKWCIEFCKRNFIYVNLVRTY